MHETFRLAQRQMKDLANQKGCFDRMIGILLWSPMCACFCWSPFIDRSLGEPDRYVAALTQRIVVLRPVGNLVFWLDELVAAALAMFEGHWLFLLS